MEFRPISQPAQCEPPTVEMRSPDNDPANHEHGSPVRRSLHVLILCDGSLFLLSSLVDTTSFTRCPVCDMEVVKARPEALSKTERSAQADSRHVGSTHSPSTQDFSPAITGRKGAHELPDEVCACGILEVQSRRAETQAVRSGHRSDLAVLLGQATG